MRTLKVLLVVLFAVLLLGSSVAARSARAAGPVSTQLTRISKLSVVRTTTFTPTPPSSQKYNIDQILPLLDKVERPLPRNSAAAPKPLLTTPVVKGLPVSTAFSGTAVPGLNAHDQGGTHGFVVEPPDQGLCAGNGYVVEAVNLVLRIYTEQLHGYSADEALETFFGNQFAFVGNPVTIQGDPKCYWDADTQRWFVSQLYLDLTNNRSMVQLAVSTTPLPTGSWNIYSIDTTDDGTDGTMSDPGCPCFGDQPLLGASRDAVVLSTNEYSINGPEFNGAILYVIDKTALSLGQTATLVIATPGLSIPTPDNVCCWYSVQPALSPNSNYDNNHSGTEYFLSALEFFGTLDDRIAIWALTNLKTIHGVAPQISLSLNVLTSETYGPPPFAAQKFGPTPLGDTVYKLPEGPIQTNDDRMNQVTYAGGLLYSGLNTVVAVPYNGSNENRAGIAYFMVYPTWSSGLLQGKVVGQGYVAVTHNDVLFPSFGVTTAGKGVMTYTFTGNNAFPSSAMSSVNTTTPLSSVVVTLAGKSPQDGFSEYQDYGTSLYSPRWGDYSAAVADGSTVYFANEYIQYPNCSDQQFLLDPTCNGTREQYANWGTSLNMITP